MIRRIAPRVAPICCSTGVPAIGKNRIRCSGGGKGVTSSIRRSSVWLVRSPCAYAPRTRLLLFAMTVSLRKKKTAGGRPAVLEFGCAVCLRDRLSVRRAVRERKIGKNQEREIMAPM
jgi:hypothetical protein